MNVITQHPAICAVAGYWVFSAIVGGMPDPDETSSLGYRWMHRSLNILSGNLATVVPAKYLPVVHQESVTVSKTTTASPSAAAPSEP